MALPTDLPDRDAERVLLLSITNSLTRSNLSVLIAPCHIDAQNASTYLTHYCVVRADLPIGAQAANLIHAAGQSSPGNLGDGTYAVALTVKDEASLRLLAARLATAGLPHHIAIESDAPYTGQAMAIGIAPNDRKVLKRYLSALPLLRAPSSARLEHPE